MKLWLSRDYSGSGLYSLWAGDEPELDENGYFTSEVQDDDSSLLMCTFHESKNMTEIELDKGTCMELMVLPKHIEQNTETD